MRKLYKATVWDGSHCRHFETKQSSLNKAIEHFKWFGEVLSVYRTEPEYKELYNS